MAAGTRLMIDVAGHSKTRGIVVAFMTDQARQTGVSLVRMFEM